MGNLKPFIGIKKLWYGDVFSADVTVEALKTWLGTATEVKNSHQDTFQYTQDDPSVTDYINELTGKPYYRDMTDEGNKTIAFTIGEYEFEDKVALQGGELVKDATKTIGWKSPSSPELKYKGIVAKTKTGNYVVFTNAGIVAKTTMAEKNMGLGLTAVAMDNPNEGVADEYWFYGEDIDGYLYYECSDGKRYECLDGIYCIKAVSTQRNRRFTG